MDNPTRKERMENIRKQLEKFRLELFEQGIDVNKLLQPEDGIPEASGYARASDINALYENLPEQTDGLSFHDIITNEMAMMAIRWEDPTGDCLIKANEIFIHTFLECC